MSRVYFTDRDLGKQFAAILRAAGLNVARHDEHFAPNARDEEWLRVVGAKGWVAITHDRRIRYKPNELQAVTANRVALLVVVGTAPFADLARSFVATHSAIARFVDLHPPPCIAKVYRAAPAKLTDNPDSPGRIELWYRPEG